MSISTTELIKQRRLKRLNSIGSIGFSQIGYCDKCPKLQDTLEKCQAEVKQLKSQLVQEKEKSLQMLDNFQEEMTRLETGFKEQMRQSEELKEKLTPVEMVRRISENKQKIKEAEKEVREKKKEKAFVRLAKGLSSKSGKTATKKPSVKSKLNTGKKRPVKEKA